MIGLQLNTSNTTNLTSPQNPAWYRGLDLAERIASVRLAKDRVLPPTYEINSVLAQRKLKRWKEQPPFQKSCYFAERLASDKITEKELLDLLGEPAEAIRDRLSEVPDWIGQLTVAFQDTNLTDSFILRLQEKNYSQNKITLLKVINPLINQGVRRLNLGIDNLIQKQAIASLPFDPNTITSLLLANLTNQIVSKLTRTLALEVNVARIQGRLAGDTPEERFENFMEQLCQPSQILLLLEEYPVMARQLVIAINNWVDSGLEFLNRLYVDWEQICTTFTPGSHPGILVEVKGGAGDSHREGRSVLKLKFSSGLQLVYKPKSLAVDIHFQELLTWLNQRIDYLKFRTLKLINRGNYGWSEFVSYSDCNSQEELARFYERQGGYLAILYALEATDFHCDNLIAVGEHPVLVDLEALFHPHVEGYELRQTQDPAIMTMGYSVLRVGLLPERRGSNEHSEGIDVSGLGGKPGQLSPKPLAMWEGFGTDQMRIVHQPIKLQGAHNQPKLKGCEVEIMDYLDDLTKGFTRIYRLLMDYRAELLAGPLLNFSQDEIRVIFRSTKTYGNMLKQSFHPDLLRNALDRDRFFDSLWMAVEYQPYITKLLSAERADLLAGDIPLFTSRVDRRDIYTSRGQVIPEFLEESSLESVKKRLQQFSDRDLDQQLWFIQASFAAIPLGQIQTGWKSSNLAASTTTQATPERLLMEAKAVGDRLSKLALCDRKRMNWVGLSLVSEREWQLLSTGIELYNGTTGIALFLAYLGAITKEAHYTDLAKSAVQTVLRQLKQLKKSQQPALGAFTGISSPIYLFSHLAALWNDSALLDEAEELLPLLPSLIEQDKSFDVIGGSAGCISSLLSLYRVRPTAATLATAIECGNHLVAHAQPMSAGVGWLNPAIGEVPLTGFSHGAAGIALSLLELAEACGEDHFRQTALAAMAYERSVFSVEKQNWPDLRHIPIEIRERKENYTTTWCHGAAGIGMARLAYLKYNDDALIKEEIEIALQTTLNQGFGLNHSLCHGDLGNLELLLLASQMLDNSDCPVQLKRITALVLDSIDKNGWCTGIPLGLESPGLMSGLAGIGYQLLRLAEPEKVPSVLLLAPPPTTSAEMGGCGRS